MRAAAIRVGCAFALAGILALAGTASAQAAPVAGVATPDGKPAVSASSRVIVSWDGTTETIDFALGLDSPAGTVGLILPTPSKATVTLGDATLFDEVERATAPVQHREDDWWGRRAPTARAAASVIQTPLGSVAPMAVKATNAKALSRWLTKNKLQLSDVDRAQVREYGSDGWSLNLVAVTSSAPVNGELAPVQVRFATKKPVLPMRLAASGKAPTAVRVYAFGPHRSALRIAGTSRNPNAAQSVVWAGAATGSLRTLGAYLTVTDVSFTTPETQVTGDLGLVNAQADDSLIPSVVIYSPIRLLGFPLGWLLVVWGGIGALLAIGYLVNRFRSQ